MLYLAIFPAAFFFWAIYSEGLFLLLALGMFYAAGRGRWWLAGICLAAAFWTRPFGIVLIPCLLLELALAWRGRGSGRVARPRPLDVLVALGVPLLAGLALLAWSALVLGDPLVFLSTQAEWNRAFSWPWETVINAFKVAAALPFQYQEEEPELVLPGDAAPVRGAGGGRVGARPASECRTRSTSLPQR